MLIRSHWLSDFVTFSELLCFLRMKQKRVLNNHQFHQLPHHLLYMLASCTNCWVLSHRHCKTWVKRFNGLERTYYASFQKGPGESTPKEVEKTIKAGRIIPNKAHVTSAISDRKNSTVLISILNAEHCWHRKEKSQ